MSWDDDAAPRLDAEPGGARLDRVTAIPELPSEVYARRMMLADASSDYHLLSTRVDPTRKKPFLPTPRLPRGAHSPAPFDLERALLSSAPPLPLSEAASQQLASTLPPLSASTGRSTAPARTSDVDPPFELELQGDSTLPGTLPPVATRRAGAPPGLGPQPRALELAAFTPLPSAPPVSDQVLRELKDRYAMGDYSGALIVAEAVPPDAPQHAEAQRFAQNCREVLVQMYTSRLGARDQVVSMAIPADQVRWLSLDHRAGFLLSLVDATSTVEELLDISGMPRLDALRILYALLQERVIALSPRGH
jgi:hypothetical protein